MSAESRETMNRSGPGSLRGYKWDSLTEAEKEAVKESLQIAGSRAAIGFGVVSTAAAAIASGKA